MLFLGGSLQFILWHMPVSVAALAGIYFTFDLLFKQKEASINITNYGFAIMAALSSICFSYSKCVDEDQEKCTMLRYCGERFLHSSIQFVLASVIKYFTSQEPVYLFVMNHKFFIIPYIIAGFMPGLLFLNSVTNVIAGVRELNTILYSRKKPGEELMKLF